jgi:hypothetical protein
MDEARFERWLKTLGTGATRRGALMALGGLGLATLPAVADAKPKRKRRKVRSRRRRLSASAAPQPVNPIPLEFPAGFFCPFGVRLEFTGKTKTIPLPGNRFITTSPGQNVRVTNADTGEQVTLNITGSNHTTIEPNGDVVAVVTGRNLVGDPKDPPGSEDPSFLVLTKGRFSYTFDGDGNLKEELNGTGSVTDICILLS